MALKPLKFDKPGPRKKKRIPRPKVTEKEGTIQAWAEAYLMRLNIPFIRFPDVLLRSYFTNPNIPAYQKRQASKYLKGVPDLLIVHPKREGKYCRMLPLELKREDGVLTSSQLAWQEAIGTVVSYGWDQTLAEIEAFLAS